MIPFLGEVLDNNDLNVEKLAKEIIIKVEAITGESLSDLIKR